MIAETAPVVVSRWFDTGSDYAHDARLDGPTVLAVANAFKEHVFAAADGTPFLLTLPDGRYLLGDRQAEREMLDPNARDRRPYVIRAVLLSEAPSPRVQKRLRRDLEALPLPRRRGAHQQGMAVALPPVLRLPEATGPAASASYPWWPIAVLALADAGLIAYALTSGEAAVALALHGLALAAVFAWYSLQAGGAVSAAELTELERKWLENEDGRNCLADVLAEDGQVVLPDGRAVDGRGVLYPNASGRSPVYPVGAGDAEYSSLECYRGLAVLRGREKVRLAGGQVLPCAFVRQYAPGPDGRWRLRFAQWSAQAAAVPAEAQPVTASSASASAPPAPARQQWERPT